MADVKVPALFHKMSVSSQKAWYKKHGMEDTGGRSAAAAKKIKLQPRKVAAIEPDSVRAINAARQREYMAKGGRQPIGAAGSGGSNVMAGSNMSTAKGIATGIKAGFNPRVSLDPYESERAKKVGPRSLKRNEEASLDEARVDHREFATAGIMHPDMAHSPRMKTGNMTDFYSRENGDKLHGKILSNDHKTVRIEHEGKVHKFDVRRSMPTSMYKEDKDDREYGYEGDMAMSQLKSIIANSQKMHDMLEPDTDLPEWVQSKITLAEDYIVTAANYLQGEMNEESVNEGSEGKTPETETEVNLAKKHGDPKKITYGDVIKARIESAKNKALKKGD